MRLLAAYLVLAASLFAAPPASAIVVTIPLPEVIGTHGIVPPDSTGVHVTFQLPGLPAVVRSVALHVVGTTEVGVLICDTSTGSAPYPWPTSVGADMSPPQGGFWITESPFMTVTGPFDWTGTFDSYGTGATWAFLNGGVGILTFYGTPSGYVLSTECVEDSPPPRVFVTAATLIVDADFSVPAALTTWGKLKAAYR